MPRAAAPAISAEQSQQLEDDDLAQLLAATNAKRAARGKAHLTSEDVAVQVRATEQEMRGRPAGPPEPRRDRSDRSWLDALD